MKTRNAIKTLGLAALVGLLSGCNIPEKHKFHQVTNYPVGKKNINVKFNTDGLNRFLMDSAETIGYTSPDSSKVLISLDKNHIIQRVDIYAPGSPFVRFDKGEAVIQQYQDSVYKWLGDITPKECYKDRKLKQEKIDKRLEFGRKALE